MRELLHKHSKVFKKVMLAIPLDYLTRGQYVMSNASGRSKRARELRGLRGTAITLRMRAVCTDKTVLHQSPSQLFQCRHEALLPSDDTKTAGRKTRTSLSFQKPPLFNFQITLSKLLILP